MHDIQLSHCLKNDQNTNFQLGVVHAVIIAMVLIYRINGMAGLLCGTFLWETALTTVRPWTLHASPTITMVKMELTVGDLLGGVAIRIRDGAHVK